MSRKIFGVYAIRKGRIWVSAGRAVQARDGSITVTLDVLPVDGTLHLRAIDEHFPPTVFVQMTAAGHGDVMLDHQGKQTNIGRISLASSLDVGELMARAASAAADNKANLAGDWLRSWVNPPEPT